MAGSFDLLDAQVHPFGRPVGSAGAVVVQDLGPPLPQRPSEGLDLGHVVVEAGPDRRQRPVYTATALGRLTKTPELRKTSTGTNVTTPTLASDNRGEDAGASFLKATVWGKSAENACAHLVKGQQVHATGRIEQRTWTDQEGHDRREWEMNFDHLVCLAKPKAAFSGDAPSRRPGLSPNGVP